MKKWFITFVFILFVVGCAKEEGQEAGHSQKNDMSEEASVTDEREDMAVEQVEEVQEEDIPVETEHDQYMIDQSTWSVIPINGANEKVVLLTIDDAPDKYSLQMAEKLQELGVKAIFFVNGHFINTEEKAAILRAIHDMGFPIGNHTYTHRKLSSLSEEEQYEEIVSLNNRVEEITGARPKFFRAPFGINTDYSQKIVADEKMILMNWTYGYDWEKEYQSKDALTDIMVNSPFLKNGANLLMHDRKWTSEAIVGIVKGLEAKGYEIVDPGLIQTPR